jgi:hypothetical protein
MTLVRANALAGAARARGFLECTIRITKPIREPDYVTKRSAASAQMTETNAYERSLKDTTNYVAEHNTARL